MLQTKERTNQICSKFVVIFFCLFVFLRGWVKKVEGQECAIAIVIENMKT